MKATKHFAPIALLVLSGVVALMPLLSFAVLCSGLFLQDKTTVQACRRLRLPIEDLTMIPRHTVILLSGIPATGKSEFARYLAGEHGFVHYDMERFPSGWPRQELKEIWEKSRPAFVAHLRQEHQRIVLDWGFPPSSISFVNDLRSCGVKLVWFEGDVEAARKQFKKRSDYERSVENFERQVSAIKTAKFPAALNCVVVPALSAKGVFLDQSEIESLVLP